MTLMPSQLKDLSVDRLRAKAMTQPDHTFLSRPFPPWELKCKNYISKLMTYVKSVHRDNILRTLRKPKKLGTDNHHTKKILFGSLHISFWFLYINNIAWNNPLSTSFTTLGFKLGNIFKFNLLHINLILH